MQDVKSGSSGWINKQRFVEGAFAWQEGYGAFSYSRSQLPQVVSYIENQTKHHEKVSFLDEYKHLLESLDMPFDERHIFKPVVLRRIFNTAIHLIYKEKWRCLPAS
jgi:Transposase IS200 like.